MKKIIYAAVAMMALTAGKASAQYEIMSLPAVPDTLRQPLERADFIVRHFWDSADFESDSRTSQTEYVEQPFADFVTISLIADTTARRDAFDILLHKAAGSDGALTALNGLAEKYLYNPDSPFLSEDTYAIYLEEFLKLPYAAGARRIRPLSQLVAISKNRPGNDATDFEMETVDGRHLRLGSLNSVADRLLIFYDPDCDHCMEVIGSLAADPVIKNLAENNKIEVVAVYSGEERDLWEENAATLPPSWIIGYEDGTLQDNGDYIIRSLPTLYLIDRNGKVVLKEPTPENLVKHLSTL